jgi:Ca-activated chloride channel family protein
MAGAGMDLIQQLHFLRPLWLLGLPLAWGGIVWLARRRNRNGSWAGLIDPELLPGLRLAAGGETDARSPWPWLALAWTLALLAMAGPAWQRDVTPAWRAPAAWVLLLDLSPSMTATDVTPDRASRARYAIDDLLAAARDARVGLVAFGDEAFTVTPLTEDVATVRALLPALAPSIMPTPGDNLAPALEQAEKLLRQTGQKNGQIVVLSDGFTDPTAAFTAAQHLYSQGVTLNVVGIGSAAGAPLTLPGGGLALDAQGKPRLARLDTDRLRQLAASGGGRYVDLAGLPSLIADMQTHSERTRRATDVTGIEVAHWRDAGIWLLPVLLLLAAFLGRRGWLG